MTHTTNFNLSQWAKSDRIQMADFNADNQKIDAALAACCRCHIEGYTGTGATTRTFTFTGKPVLLVMLSGYSLTVLHRGFGTAITFLGTTTTFYSSVTWGGDSVTLTRASGGDGIANGQSTAYGLFALLEGN